MYKRKHKVFKVVSLFIVSLFFLLLDITNIGYAKSNIVYFSVDDSLEEVSGDVSQLYSLSACLLDGESGRVLFEKDGYTLRANASTTKILTCIVALEYGNLDDLVVVSKYAASMPDVQLGINKGETYLLSDLLYSLMLESHNDSAVAIAEHISGDVKAFSQLMNEKAKELGCYDTNFITPNGLDATQTEDGVEKIHGTTATDLAKIMAYCIKNEKFIEITRASSYSFSNKVQDETGNIVNGSRSFTVNNKNAFLSMMDGALSGKTGFTNAAGYCYVGALKKDGKTLIVALLGAGWPNNKNYKWADTKKLMNYGLNNYQYKDLFNYDTKLNSVVINNGVNDSNGININSEIRANLYIREEAINLLVNESEEVSVKYEINEMLEAPVKKGDIAGYIYYYLNGEKIKTYPVFVEESIEEISYKWCLSELAKSFFGIN